ncbi:MAG TPA: Stp1/IreP family PP2C-type Ser/Thr phosphatase [Anaerolineae bacterium]|nr:Stp1/IreP family PP2C-type Ser/Thr phosphatase [Anaerolineae bacterium]
MKCSVCGTHNAPEARFCRRCSAALPREAQVETGQARDDETTTSPLSDEDTLSTHPFEARLGTRPLDDKETAVVVAPAAEAEATQPLPRPRFIFEALPIGALVGGLPYEILNTMTGDQAVNVYAAQDRHKRIRCRSCAYARNTFGDEYCQQCGALLIGIEPHHPQFTIKESMAADAIAIERRLADMRLHHGGALLPLDTFSEQIAGTRRYYVVLPEPSLSTGVSLAAPQELLDVLSWGVMLSESLAFLHQRNIAVGAADLAHISFENRMARWFDFSAARIVTPGVEGRALLKEDVATLAAALFVLLTGQMYSPRIVLEPPSLTQTFTDVFSGKLTTAAGLADRLRSALAEVRRPASYDLRSGRLTDVGQMRQLNEDSLLTLELGQVHRSVSRPIGVYVVADGAGGHAAGDVASGIAVRSIANRAIESLFPQQLDESTPSLDLAAWLQGAIQAANEAVHRQRAVARTDMGTVLVLVVILNGEAHIAHVGDSRVYLINDSAIKQLTVDHSLVQRLVDTGQIKPEEARTHENRNVIYKMIGDRPKIEPDVTRLTLAPGDRLLLCSDGLCGYVEDTHIRELILSAASPQEACQRLIDAANQAGGSDNITAVLVQIDALGEA